MKGLPLLSNYSFEWFKSYMHVTSFSCKTQQFNILTVDLAEISIFYITLKIHNHLAVHVTS